MGRPARTDLAISAVLAFSLFGDSLLYNVLPLYAESLGLPLFSVGLLLSANRWVRLLSNSAASRVFRRWGLFWPLMAAAVLGMISTMGYVVPGGLGVFLAARLLWGICWSHLRLGAFMAVVAATAQSALGAAMGWMHAITRLGSAATVLFGGLLVDVVGYHRGVFIMAVLSGGAVVLLLSYRQSLENTTTEHFGPAEAVDDPAGSPPIHVQLSPLFCNLSIFAVSLINTGLVMASLSLLLRERLGTEVVILGAALGIATFSGVLHSLRWVSAFIVSPLVGGFSDRWGRWFVYLWLSVVQIAALAALALLAEPVLTVLAAVVLFFAGNSLKVVLDAAIGDSVRGLSSALVIGRFNSASDLGAASGPLIGYGLVAAIGLTHTYLAGVALLIVVLAGAAAHTAERKNTGKEADLCP